MRKMVGGRFDCLDTTHIVPSKELDLHERSENCKCHPSDRLLPFFEHNALTDDGGKLLFINDALRMAFRYDSETKTLHSFDYKLLDGRYSDA